MKVTSILEVCIVLISWENYCRINGQYIQSTDFNGKASQAQQFASKYREYPFDDIVQMFLLPVCFWFSLV
jgi:hypothetical protein